MSVANGRETESTGPVLECPSNRLRRRGKYPSINLSEASASDMVTLQARSVKAVLTSEFPFRPPEQDEANEQVTAQKLRETRCALLIG